MSAAIDAAIDAAVERIIRRVAELPDRTSPDEWPEAMLVTADELDGIVRAELEARVPQGEPVAWLPAESLDRLKPSWDGERIAFASAVFSFNATGHRPWCIETVPLYAAPQPAQALTTPTDDDTNMGGSDGTPCESTHAASPGKAHVEGTGREPHESVTQQPSSPARPDDAEAVRALAARNGLRVLQRHGGTADPWQHHWNLTESDSALHRDSAAALLRLLERCAEAENDRQQQIDFAIELRQRAESAERQLAEARAALESWKDFARAVGNSINCLYSTFPEGNQHIIAKVAKLAACERDAARWRKARAHGYGVAFWAEFAKPMVRYLDSADDAIDAAINREGRNG